MKVGIVIQARTGSTRLPNKMLLPFYQDKTIPDIILQNLTQRFDKKNIILATSANKSDDALEAIADKNGVEIIRGSESDVLSRFCDAVKKFEFDAVVRVCADNPFLNIDCIDELIKNFNISIDYLSYHFPDKTPVIKSHIGLFAEMVNSKVLLQINNEKIGEFYREHVTNYIYGNPERFDCQFVDLPDLLQARQDIRLTVDTKTDFINMQNLYFKLSSFDASQNISNLVKCIDSDSDLLESMRLEIVKNSK